MSGVSIIGVGYNVPTMDNEQIAEVTGESLLSVSNMILNLAILFTDYFTPAVIANSVNSTVAVRWGDYTVLVRVNTTQTAEGLRYGGFDILSVNEYADPYAEDKAELLRLLANIDEPDTYYSEQAQGDLDTAQECAEREAWGDVAYSLSRMVDNLENAISNLEATRNQAQDALATAEEIEG